MDHNFISCLLITFIVLYLIKECFTIHMGPICAYDNTICFVLLIAVLLIVAIGRSTNLIEFNLPGTLLGIVCFLISFIISYFSYKAQVKNMKKNIVIKENLLLKILTLMLSKK